MENWMQQAGVAGSSAADITPRESAAAAQDPAGALQQAAAGITQMAQAGALLCTHNGLCDVTISHSLQE